MNNKKYPNGSLYLSGGMQHAENYGTGWRATTSAQLKEMGFYPIDIARFGVEYHTKFGDPVRPLELQNNRTFRENIRQHYIQPDLSLIQLHSDAIVVLYDESVRQGAGTISECQYAFNLNKPIFLVSTYKNWSVEVPDWLKGLTTKIFTSMSALYTYLSSLPEGALVNTGKENGGVAICLLCGDITTRHLFCPSCEQIKQNVANSSAFPNRLKFFEDIMNQENQ